MLEDRRNRKNPLSTHTEPRYVVQSIFGDEMPKLLIYEFNSYFTDRMAERRLKL